MKRPKSSKNKFRFVAGALVAAPAKSVRVKGCKYLAVVMNADFKGGSVSGFNAALAGRDANNDNTVDIADFGILVNHYSSVGQ